MQTKLCLNLSIFGMVIFVCGCIVIPSLLSIGSAGAVKQAAIYGLFTMVILGFSYLIAVTMSRRLAILAAQAEAVSLRPGLQQIDVPESQDEVAVLAAVINDLASRLTKGEEMRNQLAADVAHELRTPVAIIRGHLETMLKGAVELKPDNLLLLLDETRRMSRLIQDMRDLSLAEAGRLQLDRAWVPFAAMLQEIVTIMETEAEAKGITLQLQGSFEGEAYCDIPRIKQVLVNLIGNALRYVQEGGEVIVAYKQEAGVIRVKIADNGSGIEPEHLPYLFKRFYRVEESRSRQSGGTGLGLAIAKEFIEAHGGSIEVFSQVGEGTVFTVFFPVYPLNP